MSTVKERSGELWVLRQARRFGMGKSPLRRPSDRIEAGLLWCGLVVALLLIPVAAAIGTSVGHASDESAARQRAVLRQVKATTLEDTERHVPSAPGDVLSQARVSYIDANGIAREGTTSVVIGTKAGDEVTVWLDANGVIVAAPRTNSDAVALGTAAGLSTLAGSWLLLWGAVRLALVPLKRSRFRDWDAEWQAVAPRWLRGQK
jgi:hypothetical protein